MESVSQWIGNAAQWVGAASGLAAFVFTVANIRSKKFEETFSRLQKLFEAHEKRLMEVEMSLRHFPDRASFHNLEIGMADMKGQMAVVAERLASVKAMYDRLQEFMLEHEK